MKRLLNAALLFCAAFSVLAQGGELQLNGLASYTQLRKEYYLGGLFLGWPGRDTAVIANMPGKKRMELRVTADRWPPMRFAQQWNQLILINNDSAVLDANVMDVLAFTGFPKGDLVEGDHLVIELEPEAGTVVSLNGTTVLHTGSPALFNLLLNTWIGLRPPSSEFKRDILNRPTDKTGTELQARFEATAPNEARKKAVAAWTNTNKSETETSPVKPKPAEVSTVARNEPPAKPKPAELKPPPAPVAATSAPTKTTAPDTVRETVANNSSAQVNAQRAKEEHDKAQTALYNEYLVQVRRQVNKHIEYPRRAIKEGLEGLVVVRVQLDRLGNLLSMELAQSAHDTLDKAAQNAVKNALPFPAAGERLEGNEFQFLVPIVFKLTH